MQSIHVWSIFIRDTQIGITYQLPQKWCISRADPFIFNFNDETFLIFEEFNIFRRHGYIVSGRLCDQRNALVETKVIHKARYHSSFPTVLDAMNEDHMLLSLETEEAGALSLYELKHPFTSPRRIKSTLNQKGVDPVYFKFQNMWYMFVSLYDECAKSYCNNLHIYYSKDLLNSPFQAHPLNPVKLGSHGSRMAGCISDSEGRLFRVGQDCVSHYGNNVVKWEILKLSPTEYEEVFIETIQPERGFFARHTHNQTDTLLTYDQKKVSNDFRVMLFLLLSIPIRIVKRLKS